MSSPSEGSFAPNFDLEEDKSGQDGGKANTGRSADLFGLRGSAVVIYFYPKDDTPGCTAEAKDFSCLSGEFRKAGAHVIGISPDNTRSHAKFREKHDLKVRLASDESKDIANAYGVWVEKQMYGRTYMGVERATFLIDKSGKIARIWRNVKVPAHADDVLAAVKAL